MGTLKKLATMVAGAAIGAKVTQQGANAVKTLFDPHTKRGQDTLIGHVCEITSRDVTETAGQALYDDGAGDLILQVRCSSAGLTRNMDALIVAYDPKSHVYEVEPL